MGATLTRAFAGIAATLTLAAPLQAQQRFGADVMKNYGGDYSSACANPAAARLRVLPDALVFTEGGRTMTGHEVQSAYSWFGNSAPEGFMVALLSQVKGANAMTFIVLRDAQGQYVTLDADGKLGAALGKARLAAKYRFCGPPRTPEPAAAPAPAMPPGIGATGYEVFKQPGFKALYRRQASALLREPWLASLEGPSSTVGKVSIDGVEFAVADVCKPHDCYDHNVLFLYAAPRGPLYAKVHQAGRVTLLGAPPPAVVRELDRQWTKAFRSR